MNSMETNKIYYPEKLTKNNDEVNRGLIHLYYGTGVGKTTRAIGLAIRAAGAGLKVALVQFMKPGNSSEINILKGLPNIIVNCSGNHPFLKNNSPDERHIKHAEKSLAAAYACLEKNIDLLICDEMLDTLFFSILTTSHLLELMKCCKGRIEIVITGRDAPGIIKQQADYITKFNQIKHPYCKGVKSRKGIEY